MDADHDTSEQKYANENQNQNQPKLTRIQEITRNAANNENGSVRVLALDGGGLRGVISLRILAALEKEANDKICNLFDLIIGTSTGGLIALGLGHLKKNIPDCDDIYDAVGDNVFAERQPFSGLGGVLRNKYSAQKLETTLKEFTAENKAQGPLVRPGRQFGIGEPLVGVVAINANKSIRSISCLLRDYDITGTGRVLNIRDDMYPGFSRMKLWQAARATSAAPHYFSPCVVKMVVGHVGTGAEKTDKVSVQFVDGGLNANVPAGVACVEAASIWPKRQIICVSIGTGKTPENVFQRTKWPFVDVEDIIDCATSAAASTSKMTMKALNRSQKLELIRWNNFISGDACGMDEYQNIEYWRAVGQNWVDQNNDKIKELAQLLKNVHVNDGTKMVQEYEEDFKPRIQEHARKTKLVSRQIPVDIKEKKDQNRREYLLSYDAVAYFNKKNVDISDDLVKGFQKKGVSATVRFDKRGRESAKKKEWLVIGMADTPEKKKWKAVDDVLTEKIRGWGYSCDFKFGVINNPKLLGGTDSLQK